MLNINKIVVATLFIVAISGVQVFAADNSYYNIVKDSTICSQKLYEGNVNGGNGYYKYEEELECEESLKDYSKVSLNNKNMNMEIFGDRGIILYGEPTDIPNNEFQVVTNGYFTVNGLKGEYEYLGYDHKGIPVQSPYFSQNSDNFNFIVLDKPWTIKGVCSKYDMINAQEDYDYYSMVMSSTSSIKDDIKNNFGALTTIINSKEVTLNDFIDKNKLVEDIVIYKQPDMNLDMIINIYVIDISQVNPEIREITFHGTCPWSWHTKNLGDY